MAIIPTLQELKNQAIADIESAVGRSAPLLPVSVWEILATAMAGIAYGIYKFGQWVRRQIFVETADEDALLARGREYGLEPTPATLFIATITATGTNGSSIPSGSILVLNGITYVTTADGVIGSGSSVIAMEATSPGASSNLEVSDTLEFSTPIAGVNRSVTVTSITQSGEDAEDLEAFRRRVTFRQQLPPQGGSRTDYIIWTTEVPGIAEAYVFGAGGGVVNVYPLTTSTDVNDRIPDGAKITEVQDYLDDLSLKPLNDNPSVLAFDNVAIAVEVTNLVPNTPELQAIIEEEFRNFLLSRRPRQFPDEADPVNLVNTSQLITVATLAGARFLEVALEKDATPFDTYTLADNEICYLDNDEVVFA